MEQTHRSRRQGVRGGIRFWASGVQRVGGAAEGVGVEWWANMEDKHGDNGEHNSKEDVDEEMEEETHQHVRGIGREGGGA